MLFKWILFLTQFIMRLDISLHLLLESKIFFLSLVLTPKQISLQFMQKKRVNSLVWMQHMHLKVPQNFSPNATELMFWTTLDSNQNVLKLIIPLNLPWLQLMIQELKCWERFMVQSGPFQLHGKPFIKLLI